MSRVRGPGLVLVCLLVLGALALPAAFGQAPAPPKYFILKVQADPKQVIAKDLGTTTIAFNVSATPSQAGNPLNGQFVLSITTSTNKTVSPPNGWAWTDLTPSSFQLAPDGKPQRVTATVSLTVRPPAADSVSPSYDFHMKPQYTGGGAADPLTGPLVQQMGQEDTQTSHADVARSLTPSAAIASWVKDNKWILLLAAGGIAIVGVVLVRKKGGGLAVTTDSPIQEVLPGRGASFPLDVRSEGTSKQAVTLATSEVPQGWSAILPVEKIELAGNDSSTIWLTLKAPADAQPGQHVQVSFVATNAEGQSAEALVEAVVVERYGAGAPSNAPAEPHPRRVRSVPSVG